MLAPSGTSSIRPRWIGSLIKNAVKAFQLRSVTSAINLTISQQSYDYKKTKSFPNDVYLNIDFFDQWF